MILSDRPWKLKYSREDADLVSRFYVPALSTAIRYDRTTGYFRAGSLALAARGIEHLALNNGVMRLLVGCTLDEAEVQAIERGTSMPDVISAKADLTLPETTGASEREALELLAWMVGRRMLEVKVAVPCDERTRKPRTGSAIFHEKAGIIEDKTGAKLAFVGSINETVQGWMHNGETFHVYTSFGPAHQYVAEEEQAFECYWRDEAVHTRVYDFPTAVKEDLLRFLPEDDQLPRRLRRFEEDDEEEQPLVEPEPPARPGIDADAERRALWERVRTAAGLAAGGVWVGEATSPMEAWPHQRRASCACTATPPTTRRAC